ncbi:MAG: hypothetical protein PHY45_05320 [Rhodocyclaceae bacterium]|nr:hypothetical protein [Rhodocyclaceae bacterium]
MHWQEGYWAWMAIHGRQRHRRETKLPKALEASWAAAWSWGGPRRCACSFAGLLALSGCATPDLRPFAAETAALAGSITAEQAEAAARFAQVKARVQARDAADTRVKQLSNEQASAADNAKAIEAVMTTAATYSDALADLAAQGETGAAAADTLAKALQGFSTALGIAFPLAGEIPAWAGKLTAELAQDVTRIQAQESLAAATKAADAAVAKIAKAVADIYRWPDGAQAMILDGLQKTEEGVLRDEVGKNRLAFYQAIAVARIQLPERTPQTRLEYFFGAIDDRLGQQDPAAGICGVTAAPAPGADGKPVNVGIGGSHERRAQASGGDPHCLGAQTVQGLQAVVALLAGIEPQYQAYTRDLAASRAWLQRRGSVGEPIAKAASAWAAAHHEIAVSLEQCGGMHALRRNCGNLNFGHLKLAVGRLRAIAARGENSAGQ